MVAEAKQYAVAENRGDMFCAVKIGVIERYGYKEKPCCAGLFFVGPVKIYAQIYLQAPAE